MFDSERTWFERHPLIVAYDLVGAMLTVERDGVLAGGRIVEVEAYAGPDDLASHAGKYRVGGDALRSEVGRLYMYRSYGIHTMLNIVAHEIGESGAVLVRALEPCVGIEAMMNRRGHPARSLASGPGSLAVAMGLRLTDNDIDLLGAQWIAIETRPRRDSVLCGPRIGINEGQSVNWRLFDSGSRHVSVRLKGTVIGFNDLACMIPPVGTIIT